MPSNLALDPPISHPIADGKSSFAETALPSMGGAEHDLAHVAFHFGAMYVLQIAQQAIVDGSGEGVTLAIGVFDAELDQFMSSHAVILQYERTPATPILQLLRQGLYEF